MVKSLDKTKHQIKYNKKQYPSMTKPPKQEKLNHLKSPSNQAHIRNRYLHNHLMARKDPLVCESCDVEFTAKHTITERLNLKYVDSRIKQHIPHQSSEALQPALQSINIINFLKEIKLYNLI